MTAKYDNSFHIKIVFYRIVKYFKSKVFGMFVPPTMIKQKYI